MELQTIFTQVIQHLARQDHAAILSDEDSCAYRGAAGTKCAVGYLISDRNYSERIENHNLEADDVLYALTRTIGQVDPKAIDMLKALQQLHDSAYQYLTTFQKHEAVSYVKSVRREVENIAAYYDVIVPRAFYDWLAKYGYMG